MQQSPALALRRHRPASGTRSVQRPHHTPPLPLCHDRTQRIERALSPKDGVSNWLTLLCRVSLVRSSVWRRCSSASATADTADTADTAATAATAASAASAASAATAASAAFAAAFAAFASFAAAASTAAATAAAAVAATVAAATAAAAVAATAPAAGAPCAHVGGASRCDHLGHGERPPARRRRAVCV